MNSDVAEDSHEPSLPPRKRIGGYLVEAGLLTPDQVTMALNEQKINGMRFGEILAARGWVKQEAIEHLMENVILPEQKSQQQPDDSNNSTHQSSDVDL